MTLSRTLALLAFSALTVSAHASDVVWFDGSRPVTYNLQKSTDPVVKIALQMFDGDMKAVTGMSVAAAAEKSAALRIVELDKASKSVRKQLAAQGVPVDELDQKTDGFHISVSGSQVLVVGANGRGTAYGLLEMSRMAGVSPWV